MEVSSPSGGVRVWKTINGSLFDAGSAREIRSRFENVCSGIYNCIYVYINDI